MAYIKKNKPIRLGLGIRFLAALLALFPGVLFAQTVWDGTADSSWYTSDKDADTYTISTAEGLAGLAQLVNEGEDFEGKTITLGADIALNDTTANGGWQDWDENATGLTEWTAIGTDSDLSFQGTFDGDGHVVSGIYINNTNTSDFYQGLFGYVSGGTIKNLGVVAFYIKGYRFVGGLVGMNIGTISNNYSTGNVVGTSDYVGGLVGSSYGSIVSNSYFTGNVEGIEDVGGLVGSSYGSSTISNSYATGNVKGGNLGNVGGLVGSNSNSTISNSYSAGNVVGGNGGNAGGLVGRNDIATISNSYATGNVEGPSGDAGGLVGENSGGTIINSYSTGNVKGSCVGGLVGSNNGGTINYSYAIGNVSATSYYAGGLVGLNFGTITNSYYNTETSEQLDTEKGTPKTTAEMQTIETYSGWDFESVWAIDQFSNNEIPYFQWQITMQVEPIEPQLYTGSTITPTPKVTALDGTELIPNKDFAYFYEENRDLTTGGTVYIVGKGVYFGTKTVTFAIKPIKTVDVIWSSECDITFTYNGSPVNLKATASGYTLVVEGIETNAGIGLTAIAKLATPEDDVVLRNASCSYKIAPKSLEVSWTSEREFTYNKMTQGPTPSVAEPGIELRVSNIYSGVGEYTAANKLAPYAVIISANAGNYELSGNSVDYEIKPKPLKPYFAATLPDFSTNKADTLWVPYDVFNDSAALHSVLTELIDYDGFATDDKGKSDDASVLKGSPEIALQYTQKSPFLPRRVETTQKATAIIVTDEVAADNYALTRPAIVIMATVEESEDAEKVFCRLGSNCAEFSAEVCSAISGEAVESCEIKVACVINTACIKDFPLETCSSMNGEVVPSCEEVSTLRPTISATPFRVWQTASGMVNVDLGYMPVAPAVLQVYDLKGKLVATERVNTRFANIRVNVPNGVYLFRVGNAKKIVKIYFYI